MSSSNVLLCHPTSVTSPSERKTGQREGAEPGQVRTARMAPDASPLQVPLENEKRDNIKRPAVLLIGAKQSQAWVTPSILPTCEDIALTSSGRLEPGCETWGR